MDSNNRKAVTILVDNDSWILPYAERLVQEIQQLGRDAELVRTAEAIREGWVCFLLGCVKIVEQQYLKRNYHNLVVHESDLPKGRGFAPMAWQILHGANSIPVCLLEASAGEPDAGDIWLRDSIELEGQEMLPVWRQLQGEKTIELCMRFVKKYDSLRPVKQTGEPSWYKRRRPADSELDLYQSIKDQFNLLRIVDNQRYPAFFQISGNKILLNVEQGCSDD
jgi:methionyl-tRNA formyltransferase